MIPVTGIPSLVLFLIFLFSDSLASIMPFDLFPHGKEEHHTQPQKPIGALPEVNMLENIIDSLEIMQDEYFEHWRGTWPTAIDWTAAVMQTILTGTLKSVSVTLNSPEFDTGADWKVKENLIDTIFDQVVGSYFGQNALSIRQQAYDDMLWVVLGWLEAIQFVDSHSEMHYGAQLQPEKMSGRMGEILTNASWHGTKWTPTFAHRAAVFWDDAHKGWDTKLCGGGMVWNPRLNPYKNAITNELWISASIKMYLHFPGDSITAPFVESANCPRPPCLPRHPKFLAAAIDGFKWLTESGMVNKKGLFADGFHISKIKEGGTKCDLLDKMVYTYNQGVLLSGCRGLYQATGASSYLDECHQLLRNVILATGWDILNAGPMDDFSTTAGWLPPWHGLGRAGVLEEKCDVTAKCSQNGQTFKGIFFHHLTEFCSPFSGSAIDGLKSEFGDPADTIEKHRRACIGYSGWVSHNARAAWLSRDTKGRFGMWWTAGIFGWDLLPEEEDEHNKGDWVDYRTFGIPDDGVWQDKETPPIWTPEGGNTGMPQFNWFDGEKSEDRQRVKFPAEDNQQQVFQKRSRLLGECLQDCDDPNTRGRGRTVETQAGGISVLRAAWEFAKLEERQ